VLSSHARDEWIGRALDPHAAKQFQLLAVHLPRDGFSSAEGFKHWLMESESKGTADTMPGR